MKTRPPSSAQVPGFSSLLIVQRALCEAAEMGQNRTQAAKETPHHCKPSSLSLHGRLAVLPALQGLVI